MYIYTHHGDDSATIALDKKSCVSDRAFDKMVHSTLGFDIDCPVCRNVTLGSIRGPNLGEIRDLKKANERKRKHAEIDSDIV